MVAYRIIQGKGLLERSYCPRCRRPIARYDLIPVISWIFLRGLCRSCKEPISILYPFIEVLTAVLAVATYHHLDPHYWLAYGLFFSALIVVIRTDFETMLISRYTTWCMIPVGSVLAALGALPLTLQQSLLGACFGYVVLWIIARAFYAVRSIEGLGEGDLDLLAMIGSFTGILGAWTSLFIGSFFGAIIGLIVVFITKDRSRAIPFGPWLSLGAIIYVFTQKSLLLLL
ncbi:prepilin peptidase [Candidatus Dependentiae bacterium]|nr:prepilin peptidase [Candidatus Dependentiae bacterium]